TYGFHTFSQKDASPLQVTIQESLLKRFLSKSLMCIPFGRSRESSFTVVGILFPQHNQYGAIIYLCMCSYV
uniref:Uncharacterized protein n=1 Tax=Naja naja TaxID=35670 RepID=A0A8C6XUD9_NAJNA